MSIDTLIEKVERAYAESTDESQLSEFRLNKAAWIGEQAPKLIEAIKAIRESNAELLKACRCDEAREARYSPFYASTQEEFEAVLTENGWNGKTWIKAFISNLRSRAILNAKGLPQ